MPSDTERYSTSFYNLVRPAWHQRQAMACLFIRTHALRISVSNFNVLYVCQGICYRKQRTKPRSSCSAPAAAAAASAIIWPCMYSHRLPPPPVFPFSFMRKKSSSFLRTSPVLVLEIKTLARDGLNQALSRPSTTTVFIPSLSSNPAYSPAHAPSIKVASVGVRRRCRSASSAKPTQTHTRCFTAGYLENTRVRGS